MQGGILMSRTVAKKNRNNARNIVVIDDDPAILDALSAVLENEGYHVNTSMSAEKKTILKNGCPDLMLIDTRMSGADGRDICRSFKTKKLTRKIPIIMFSAEREIENSARLAGADEFIAKPFELDDLLSKIREYVN